MAHDEEVADRVRVALQHEPGVVEKRMFGGPGFLVDGHLAVPASGQGGPKALPMIPPLMVRVDSSEGDGLVDGALVERVVMRGLEMDGWLRVASEAVQSDDALQSWVRRGVAAARCLTSQ